MILYYQREMVNLIFESFSLLFVDQSFMRKRPNVGMAVYFAVNGEK